MRRSMRLLVLVALVGIVCGCRNSTPRMLRVSAKYPGASPGKAVDSLAYPMEIKLLGLPDIASITSISSTGSLQIYIVVEQDARPPAVLRRVVAALQTMDRLPSAATAPTVELLPTTAVIPGVRPTQIDCLVVDLNREAIAKYGISNQAVVSAVQEQCGGSASDVGLLARLRAIRVSDHQGHAVPLTDLAEIKVEKRPSYIVTRWPPEQ